MIVKIKPAKGYLTHNLNFFTSMNPYCFLYLGKQFNKTSPDYGGGIKPKWTETIEFKIDNIFKVGIEIWAKSIVGADSLIGQGMLDLRKLHLKLGNITQEYADLQFENDSAGRVLFEIELCKSHHDKEPTEHRESFIDNLLTVKNNLQRVMKHDIQHKQMKVNKELKHNPLKGSACEENKHEHNYKDRKEKKTSNISRQQSNKLKHQPSSGLQCGTVYAHPSKSYMTQKLSSQIKNY